MHSINRLMVAWFAVLFVLTAWVIPAAAAKPNEIKVCNMVSAKEVAQLYRKKLVPNEQRAGCFWSKKNNSMAYMHIGMHKYRREIRSYFRQNLSSSTELVEIKDLGDGGLMTVVEGQLGVIVVRKGDYVLQSAVIFLDIEPGTEKQKLLWKIYQRILAELDQVD